MAIDDLWTPEHADSVFCIAIGPDDKPHGFIHFVPVPQASGLSLSAMRRDPSTPNGLMEFLLCETFRVGRERGLERDLAELQRLRRAPARRGRRPAALGARPALRARQGRPLLPGRAAAAVQPQVLPALGAALRRVRAAPRPAARGDRAPHRRVADRAPAAPAAASRGWYPEGAKGATRFRRGRRRRRVASRGRRLAS